MALPGSPMAPNPYQAPGAAGPGEQLESDRTLFVLAAAGAGMASLYWALMTAGLALGLARSSTTGSNIILPGILVALYASRAYRIWKGDAGAVRGILWLHGLGALVVIIQMLSASPSSLVLVLQVVKIAIHLFGGITAYLALRSVR